MCDKINSNLAYVNTINVLRDKDFDVITGRYVVYVFCQRRPQLYRLSSVDKLPLSIISTRVFYCVMDCVMYFMAFMLFWVARVLDVCLFDWLIDWLIDWLRVRRCGKQGRIARLQFKRTQNREVMHRRACNSRGVQGAERGGLREGLRFDLKMEHFGTVLKLDLTEETRRSCKRRRQLASPASFWLCLWW